ncbi:hypothetical protein RT90_17335 [Serratia marcescens]|nr:hypothetical protein RT90_17335 [Serratia marcescens]
MAYGTARYIENLTVIPNQVGAFGLNLAADVRQQRIGQVVLEAATVNGGIQAGADDRLPRYTLSNLAPVAIAQLRQFDIVWIERFARRVLSAFIWNTKSRENGSEEPFSVCGSGPIFIAAIMDPDNSTWTFFCQKPESVEGIGIHFLLIFGENMFK